MTDWRDRARNPGSYTPAQWQERERATREYLGSLGIPDELYAINEQIWGNKAKVFYRALNENDPDPYFWYMLEGTVQFRDEYTTSTYRWVPPDESHDEAYREKIVTSSSGYSSYNLLWSVMLFFQGYAELKCTKFCNEEHYWSRTESKYKSHLRQSVTITPDQYARESLMAALTDACVRLKESIDRGNKIADYIEYKLQPWERFS